jgi:outer membrane protein assembly factor BamB
VTGTPAYDPRSRLLFVAAELRGAGHELFALDPSTGRVVWRRALPLRGSDPRAMQQRAALTVDGSEVLVAFGGLEGDCGDYHGTVVGVPTDGRGPLRSYVVPTRREGGIWAASGPAVDAAGRLYVAVGNGSSTTRYDGSDSVLELSPALHLLGFFAPSDWRQDNAGDADLGSTGPEPIPGGRLVAAGKAGIVYLLDGGRLGGVGGQLAETSGCVSYGGMASAGDTVFLPCNSGVRELVVTGQRLSWGWAAPAGAAGSPVLGGSTVWTLDAQTGTLFGLAASNGAVQALVYVGAVSRFATPALNGDEVLVGTLSGVTAVAGG